MWMAQFGSEPTSICSSSKDRSERTVSPSLTKILMDKYAPRSRSPDLHSLTPPPARLRFTNPAYKLAPSREAPLSHRASLKVPTAYSHRLSALRTRIHQKSVGGYLITNPVDQFYLTG